MEHNVIAFPTAYLPPPPTDLAFPMVSTRSDQTQTTVTVRLLHPLLWERPIRLLISVLPEVDTETGRATQPDHIACQEALKNLAINFARACFGPRAELLTMIATLEETGDGLFYTFLLDLPRHASFTELERLTYSAFGNLLDDPDNGEECPGVIITPAAGLGEILHLMGRVIQTGTDDTSAH